MSSSPTETATDVLMPATDVLMPAMGSSVVEGILVQWRVAVGDVVAEDDPLCEISTDKVDSECPSPAAGVVLELRVAAGETVDVGTVIARIGSPGAPSDSLPDPADDVAAPEVPASTPGSAGAARSDFDESQGAASGAEPVDRREQLRRSSPVALRIAAEHGLDVLGMRGTGRDGRVTKRDVLQAVETGTAGDEPPMHIESPYRHDPDVPVAGSAPVAAAASVPSRSPAPLADREDGGVTAPMSRMRTQIGAAMRRALDTAAHCTTVVECDMSAVQRRRRELGVTALPLVAAHAIETLRDFPALNATLEGDLVTTYDRVHLGIAVALGDDGLIVPVIHDAQDLSPAGIGSRVKDVARRARAKQLTADDVRGGTFTITNPGAAGAVIATPVINVPQVAILDLEAIVKRPVVITDAEGNDAIAIRPMVNLCMSWDHRAVDGMYAAQFLTALRRRIESS